MPGCSQHTEKQSEMTCLLCGQSFCSTKCFLHPGHHEYHLESKKVYVNWDLISVNETGKSECFRSKDFVYIPTHKDVGKQLILTITPKDTVGRIIGDVFRYRTHKIEMMSQTTPINREFVHYNEISRNDNSFTVMDYNILAEIYATKSVYPHVEETYLDWNYRKKNILKEISTGGQDIICLQEVQPLVYTKFLKPELEKLGYLGEYKQKTKYVYSKGAYTIDGCAIFYKKQKFSLVKKHEIEFRELAVKELELGESESMLFDGDVRRLIKDNISLVLVLKINNSRNYRKDPIFCVSNVHIMANANCKDIKLWQIHSYMKELEKFSKNGNIPTIVAGDFNSVPDSLAYELITKGRVRRDKVNKKMEGSNSFNKNIIDHLFKKQGDISHNLHFVSSYGEYRNNSEEPKYTNKCSNFTGTLDYIFYTKGRFKLTNVLKLKNMDDRDLPDKDNPSDHIPLISKFVLNH